MKKAYVGRVVSGFTGNDHRRHIYGGLMLAAWKFSLSVFLVCVWSYGYSGQSFLERQLVAGIPLNDILQEACQWGSFVRDNSEIIARCKGGSCTFVSEAEFLYLQYGSPGVHKGGYINPCLEI